MHQGIDSSLNLALCFQIVHKAIQLLYDKISDAIFLTNPK